MRIDDILDHVAAQVATITFANGYSIQIENVSRVWQPEPPGTSEFPTVRYSFVTVGNATFEKIGATKTYAAVCEVVVTADFVQAQDSNMTGTLIENMNMVGREIMRALGKIPKGMDQALRVTEVQHKISDSTNRGIVAVIAECDFTDALTAS